MGAGLEYIDVGGGLGIDYDGTALILLVHNYTLSEYGDVVYRIGNVCNTRNIRIRSSSANPAVPLRASQCADLQHRGPFGAGPL